jgi:hypothetical protein
MPVFMNTKLFTATLGVLPLAAALLCPGPARAQEQLSRAQALKYAFIVAADLKEMLKTPIATDPDLKRPVAVREGDYGGLVLPESKLGAATLEKPGKDGVPIGQLWLLKLVPMSDGQPVPANRLHFVSVTGDEGEARVPCCVLVVRNMPAGDGLELVVLGKDKTPLLTAPLKSVTTKQENPIEMAAERQSDGGLITLRLFGKYETSFMVTDPDQF